MTEGKYAIPRFALYWLWPQQEEHKNYDKLIIIMLIIINYDNDNNKYAPLQFKLIAPGLAI